MRSTEFHTCELPSSEIFFHLIVGVSLYFSKALLSGPCTYAFAAAGVILIIAVDLVCTSNGSTWSHY
jgi:hypothetical protein